MKKLFLTSLIILFTLTSNVVWSADIDKSRKIKDSGIFFNHVASDVGELFDGKWVYLGNNSSGDNYYGEIDTIKENNDYVLIARNTTYDRTMRLLQIDLINALKEILSHA